MVMGYLPKLKREFVFIGILLNAAVIIGFAQSSDQSYPTPVTTSEVAGVIKARDIGDARLTSYFYTFNGDQGDIFVNVVSKNFTGDIDIFIADGLRPLSKIIVYADSTEAETGRVIYLRKPEKLILRIEGRSPNDDPATFKLKFAGSFVAAVDTGEQQPDLPEVKVENDSGVRVNSVGTIIAVTPKPKRTPKPVGTAAAKPVKTTEPEKRSDEDVSEKKDEVVEKKDSGSDTASEKVKTEPRSEPKRVEVVVSENIPEGKTDVPAPKQPLSTRTGSRRRPVTKKVATGTVTETPGATEGSKPPTTSATAARTRRIRPATPKEPNPLENIHLVIVFKDGRTIEKPMSEVLRFSVDNGILTVISKNGTIGRYPIGEVLKTTIE